jgi:S-DNA-T family DNA segregation ATPase FtsK/SpoIIIE
LIKWYNSKGVKDMNIQGHIRPRIRFNTISHGEDINRLNLLLSKYGLQVDNTIDAPTVTTYISSLDIDTNINRVLKLEKNIGIAVKDNNVRVYLDGDKLCIEKKGANNEVIIDDLFRGLNEKKFNLMVGIDNRGQKILCNLAKAPHILVAGTTGSGKSMFLHSCILSLLIAHPTDIDIIGIDPKGNEFLPYSGLKNFTFIKNTVGAIRTLKELCDEMDTRYDTLARANCRDIDEYNKLYNMRRKVCVIDELADLMLTAGTAKVNSQVETYIVRLAQKARACGIHLIIATQRPSADVVTGLIKTNIPTRICFAVKSQIDSRIILDEKGGEKLNGKGDMLFQANGVRDLIRCQGVNIIPEERNNIIVMADAIQHGRDYTTMNTNKTYKSHM